MLKKFFVIIIMIILIIGVSGKVLAKDKYTTTSTINGITVNWEYELNDLNQIEELRCTNVSELTGHITIPNTLDGKTIVSIGSESFKSATNIISVTISDSIKTIGYGAFNGCIKLNNVNLGNITGLSFDVFKGCASLTSITIPNTLTEGCISPSLNNTNITKITLEEGLVKVPANLCANTGITEITIPSSVKEIEYSAFENCKNLKSVDLGNITTLSFRVFKGCTNLTEITIPKSLKNTTVSPCLDNQNITKITLEEGLTIVPANLCANTGITEITIPNSVTEIGYSAFDNCKNLKKITILDNVKNMGFYNIDSSESVFKNHNSDLTIYCYKDSMAAKYAIKYNIKYVYLPRPDSDTQPNKVNPDTTKPESTPSTVKKNTEKDDTTIAKGVLPQTGVTIKVIFVVLIIVILSIIFFIKYRKFKGI